MTALSTSYLKDYVYTKRWFWLFVLSHLLLWTIGPTLFRYSVTHDTLEGIAWGMQWQWGYNKHPFLAAWLSYGITALFHTTGWPVYLLAQIAVVTTFWAVWRLSLLMVPPRHALLAALSLEGVLFYNLNSFNFTPDTLQSPLWALLALCFYKALTSQSCRSWLSVGVLAALCMLTKYQAGLLFLPMLLLLVFNKEARLSFRKPGLYLAILIALLLITPHLVWLIQHDGVTIQYALETPSQYTQAKSIWSHVTYPLKYTFNNVGNTFFVALLLWPIYRSSKMSALLTSFQSRFLVMLGLGPWLLSTLLCGLSGDHFPSRWSTPYFFLWGLMLLSYVKPQLRLKQVQAFLITSMIFMIVLWLARFSALQYANQHRDSSDASLPNIALAQKITQLWHQRYHAPLAYVAGSRYLVAALVAYASDRPAAYFSFNTQESPWIDDTRVQQRGAVVVLDKDSHYVWDKESANQERVLQSMRSHFPLMTKFMRIEIPRKSNDKEAIVILVGFIPPHLTSVDSVAE